MTTALDNTNIITYPNEYDNLINKTSQQSEILTTIFLCSQFPLKVIRQDKNLYNIK